MEELSELREFFDPDTVELMTWIRYTQAQQHRSAATLTKPQHTSNRPTSDWLVSADQLFLCLMPLISLCVCVSTCV